MARLWQCGFELNSTTTDVELSNITGAGTTIQTGTVRTGTYALRCNPSATTSFARYHIYTSNQSTVAYQRFYLRIATAPGANTTICRFVDTSNNACAQVRLTSSSTLILLDAGGSAVGSASSALSANTWYMVELGLDASSSPGTVTLRLDGTQVASGNNSVQSPWARVLVGPVVSATCDLFFDDWAVNDNSGGSQNSWPGAGKILHLVPNGDGDSHGWSDTSNAAGSANNYTLVDEQPPNDTTDLVQTGVVNTTDMYTLTDSGIGSGDTVNVVMVGVRLRNNTADATTAAKVQIEKTSGGTITQGSAIVPNTTTFSTNAPAQPRNYTLIAYVDPDGAAWTQSTLDSAQAGVKLTTAGTNRIQVTSLWVSVDYTPSSGTNASAECATGTGAANAAAASVAATAGSAAATGTANAAATAVAPAAGLASATGTANAANAAIAPPAGLASATGAANDASATVAPASGVASATGTANDAAPSIAANAGVGAATGAAYDATVTTGSATSASAGVATATGAAGDASVSVAPVSSAATGAGSAADPAPSVAGTATAATGTAAAGNATTSISATASAAAAVGVAHAATVSSAGEVELPEALAAIITPAGRIGAAVTHTGRISATIG